MLFTRRTIGFGENFIMEKQSNPKVPLNLSHIHFFSSSPFEVFQFGPKQKPN